MRYKDVEDLKNGLTIELKEMIALMTICDFLVLMKKGRMVEKLKEEKRLSMKTCVGGPIPSRPKDEETRNLTSNPKMLGVRRLLLTINHNNNIIEEDVFNVGVLT